MRLEMEEKKLQPNALVDYLLKKLGLKNDRQLAEYFDVLPPVISKIRNRRMSVSANMILLIHEKLDIPVAEIRRLIDQTRQK
jgi:transcriptional regulator with XRE-family HTH domain